MFLIIVHLHGHPTTQLVFGSSCLHDNPHVVNFHSLINLSSVIQPIYLFTYSLLFCKYAE